MRTARRSTVPAMDDIRVAPPSATLARRPRITVCSGFRQPRDSILTTGFGSACGTSGMRLRSAGVSRRPRIVGIGRGRRARDAAWTGDPGVRRDDGWTRRATTRHSGPVPGSSRPVVDPSWCACKIPASARMTVDTPANNPSARAQPPDLHAQSWIPVVRVRDPGARRDDGGRRDPVIRPSAYFRLPRTRPAVVSGTSNWRLRSVRS